MRIPPTVVITATLVGLLAAVPAARAPQTVFRGGIDLVNVTATVTDNDGRFVTGLTRDDFVVYDNGVPQEILSFSSDRVPVSLGILLDVSGSMTSDKMAAARAAINRFIFDLLGADDELFLAEFSDRSRMLQTWTQDRDIFSRAMRRAGTSRRRGGTAVYDAVVATVAETASGLNPRRALLVISDGQDNQSRSRVEQVHELIQLAEVLVYALAVEDDGRVNAGALRRLTDPSGGRTEVVRGFRNLDAATSRLADELNQQYVLGYAATAERDGQWHAIKVEVKKRGTKVRAREGYVAS